MVGLIGVVAIGLAVAEIATYVSVRTFLLERVDEQLDAASGPALARLRVEEDVRLPGTGGLQFPSPQSQQAPFPPRGAPIDFTASVPPGTYAEFRAANTETRATAFGFDEQYPVPDLPADLSAQAASGSEFTVDAVDSGQRFRVLATYDPGGQNILVVAVPLTEFDKTMERLLLVGLGVTAVVLLVLGIGAFWLVRLGLRPLDEIAATASGIASGNLEQRVPVASPRTEVGRLGTALNAMLDDLEEAFARRTASEERLRRFVADASHELRTPLTSIRGYAELFDRGAQSRPEDLAKVMSRITQQSERMSLIVEDLLLLARLDQGREFEHEPVDVATLAEEVVADARQREPGRPIALALPDSAIVVGDSTRLWQMVSNLVSNAISHTPAGTAVAVKVESTAESVRLWVTDSGPGIAADDREHIFEPFYRASASRARKGGGAGLGLAIVKAIVEAHEGTVVLSERDGGGATFEVTLPGAVPATSDALANRDSARELQAGALPAG